jgi:5-(carboxyamino)imidazole ribonucleotide mutase
VATVPIDGSKNAAYLAAEILALGGDELAEKIAADRKKQKETVLKKDAAPQEKLQNK